MSEAQFAQFGADFPVCGVDFPGSGENVRRTKGARLGKRGAVFVTFCVKRKALTVYITENAFCF